MRRCTLQCENDIGRINAKTFQKYTKMEPKWELKSIKNEENISKLRRCTLHVRRCTCNVARATLNGDKWWPERFGGALRTNGSYPFGAPWARKWRPEGRQWPPLGVDKRHQISKNVTKNVAQKSIPKKYRKTMPKLKGNGTKNDDKIDKKIVFFAKGWFCEKYCFP